ncbi:nuclear transport factor 2 family protein [Altererythrobacter confluentis]|uniref:Nuclear transport factor 2 family protein n=1 Tax=Allopontixanthobacter confluentis TaxID=1849021 RepID=A0A6L7GKN1_9SPHN|nr:nuclear transport factor 2 family protein [Allopontixanthobacter confluentis]MXP15221.1 nuclear transport factor 2 family protein [Allopontixanthobacter confluentis]
MTTHDALARWHTIAAQGSPRAALEQIIAENAVFHSPVVHTPQRGRALVVAYLSAAGQVLGNDSFTYVREVVDGNNAVLEFTAEIGGIFVNGIDMIEFDDAGQIVDFKVMVRPMKAMNKLWEMMAEQLVRNHS